MAILDGQFLTAFYWNPLGYLILVGLVILPLWLLADLIFKAQSLFDFYHLICDKLKNKKYAIPLLLLLLLNWYWNIKKGL
jgi:fumarate reductase subunit D